MPYFVKEIFYSLQGEGANVGRPAVFCRFSGCNLWSGREQDRATAVCRFCDTDFFGINGTGGGRIESAAALAEAVSNVQGSGIGDRGSGLTPETAEGRAPATPPAARRRSLVVCTGGEPLLQLDGALVEALHDKGFEVAVETNGTLLPPPGIDWITVSPKSGAPFVLKHGNEIKVVYPQAGIDPAGFEALDFEHFYLQPMDGPDVEHNRKLALEYCLARPRWRLSLQVQKYLGIR